ncbi:MAG: CPBP family intramembrane metalloprotease [Bacteroidales bacterium]|jgi:membrane protease YdiL (CAAX protease family)|nr:CPBP family intramembrane metalloprotease [Bacteroidales bacterium]
MKHLERALDGQNQWWKYLGMFILTLFVAQGVALLPIAIVIIFFSLMNGSEGFDKFVETKSFTALGIDANLGLVLSLIPFVISLLALVILLKTFHKRTTSETINGTNKIRWGRFFFAALIWTVIWGSFTLYDYLSNPENFTVNLNYTNLIILVIISLALIPLQTTYEELFFRGYLTQAFGAWTRNRWLAVVIPAILFGLIHSMNPEVSEFGFWVAMPQYIMFGLISGLTTIWDDGIEIAMGAHAANNIFLSIFLTNKASALQTYALLEQKEVDMIRDNWVLLTGGILFLVIMFVRYRWNLSVINRPIIKEA